MKFILSIETDTEAFGEDNFDREMEVARILRRASEALYGGEIVTESAELRDRHGRTVGKYQFSKD